jgi:hypothetical protein
MEEVWVNVNGYEGIYQISNLGRVKCLDRFVTTKNGVKKYLKEKIMRVRKCEKGYFKIGLRKNDIKQKQFFVHRLVAIAFIQNINNKKIINHINGIKTDNRLENLEWCTYSENQIHAYRNGLNYSNPLRGDKHQNSKLNYKQVIEIRKLIEKKVKLKEIAFKYNISIASVSLIKNKKTWDIQ